MPPKPQQAAPTPPPEAPQAQPAAPTRFAVPPPGIWTSTPARRLLWALTQLDRVVNHDPLHVTDQRAGESGLQGALTSPVRDYDWRPWFADILGRHPELRGGVDAAVSKDAMSSGDLASGGLLTSQQTSHPRRRLLRVPIERSWIEKAASPEAALYVALWPDPSYAAALAVGGGESAALLHCTVLFSVGTLTPEQARDAQKIIADWAERAPKTLPISGLGKFAAAPDSDGRDVLFAQVDSPALHTARLSLIASLLDGGVPVEETHLEYRPHVTLAFLPPTDQTPTGTPGVHELPITEILVSVGGETRRAPLGGGLSRPEEVTKYSEDQARDENGRWSDAGGAQVFGDKRGTKHEMAFRPAGTPVSWRANGATTSHIVVRPADPKVRVRPDGELPDGAVAELRWLPPGWPYHHMGERPPSQILAGRPRVDSVYVHPDFRRRGIASEMLRRARTVNPGIIHSDDLTRDGVRWSEAVKSWLVKYSDDQARDENGRWTGDGGGLGSGAKHYRASVAAWVKNAKNPGHSYRYAPAFLLPNGDIYMMGGDKTHGDLRIAMGVPDRTIAEQGWARLVGAHGFEVQREHPPTGTMLATLGAMEEHLGKPMAWDIVGHEGRFGSVVSGEGVESLRARVEKRVTENVSRVTKGATSVTKSWVSVQKDDELPPDVLAQIDAVAEELSAAARGSTERQIGDMKRRAVANIVAQMRVSLPPSAIEDAIQADFEMVSGVTSTTREMLRRTLRDVFRQAEEYQPGQGMASATQFDFAQTLQQQWEGLSARRAETIAVTEYNRTASTATLSAYQDAGITQKRWFTVGDERVCEDCDGNAAQGEVPIDEDFESGDPAPPAHPNCRCNVSSALASVEVPVQPDQPTEQVQASEVLKYSEDQARDEAGRWTDGGMAGLGPRPDFKAGDDFSKYSAAKSAWDRKATTLVALGKATPEEANAAGWHPGTRLEDWKPLPPTLFHVTTAADAVQRDGLKVRGDVPSGTAGVGGGVDDLVSFTTDRKYADAIHNSMLEMRRVATGETTAKDIMVEARKWPGVEAGIRRNMNPDLIVRGVKVSQGQFGAPPDAKHDWTPTADSNRWTGGDGKERFTTWERPMTDHERIEDTGGLWKAMSVYREYKGGGPPDPMVFGDSWMRLKDVAPSQIRTMEFEPSTAGARGQYMSDAESEYRTVPSAVRLKGIVKVEKYSDDQARDEAGRWAPAEGHTRLYRGDHPGLAGGPGFLLDERRAMRGRHFTTSVSDAKGYMGRRGTLVYVDVPTADLAGMASKDQPVDGRGTHYVLPREMADRKMPV